MILTTSLSTLRGLQLIRRGQQCTRRQVLLCFGLRYSLGRRSQHSIVKPWWYVLFCEVRLSSFSCHCVSEMFTRSRIKRPLAVLLSFYQALDFGVSYSRTMHRCGMHFSTNNTTQRFVFWARGVGAQSFWASQKEFWSWYPKCGRHELNLRDKIADLKHDWVNYSTETIAFFDDHIDTCHYVQLPPTMSNYDNWPSIFGIWQPWAL